MAGLVPAIHVLRPCVMAVPVAATHVLGVNPYSVSPPSITTAWPVTNCAASDAR
jgi:hypothetical protein